MATWREIQVTEAASDRLDIALRSLHERQLALISSQGGDALLALAQGIEALVLLHDSKELGMEDWIAAELPDYVPPQLKAVDQLRVEWPGSKGPR